MKEFAKIVRRVALAIGKHAVRMVLNVLAAAVLLAVLLAVFRIRIATAVAKGVLPHAEGFENTFSIDRLGLGGIEISNARLGGFPLAPSFDSLRVKWSLSGLRSRRIAGIELEGLAIDAGHKVPNFSMPSPGGAGEPAPSKDILRGWRVDHATLATKRLDLFPLMPTNSPPPFALDATAEIGLSILFQRDGYACEANGALFGRPFAVAATYSPDSATGGATLEWALPELVPDGRQGLEALSASMDFAFEEARGIACRCDGLAGLKPCKWRVPFKVEVSPGNGVVFSASLESLHISQDDPLARDALALAGCFLPPAMADGLSFTADLSAAATVMAGGGVPRWEARFGLSDTSLSIEAGGVPVRVAGGRVRGSASGCGDVIAIAPCHISLAEASAGPFGFGRSRATILPEGDSLVVSEASIGFCGGALRLYALYLNMAKLSTGFTVVLDNLLLSEFLELFPQTRGSEATGRLYGRMPLRVANGEVRLGEGFIYSPPGETGVVKMANSGFVADFFSQAGLPPAVCDNIAKALKNLNYDVFRMDLVNPRQEDGRLALRLQGKAPDGKVVTPVNINANINGPIEKFLNLAIKTATIGTQQK